MLLVRRTAFITPKGRDTWGWSVFGRDFMFFPSGKKLHKAAVAAMKSLKAKCRKAGFLMAQPRLLTGAIYSIIAILGREEDSYYLNGSVLPQFLDSEVKALRSTIHDRSLKRVLRALEGK
jgi:hypothetical protein